MLYVSTNLQPALGPGLAIAPQGQEWTILPGFFVTSTNDDGVSNDFEGGSLYNYGTIIADVNGVSFSEGGFVVNGYSGFIKGGSSGIQVFAEDGEDAIIINQGRVEASQLGIAALTEAGSVIVDNSGLASAFYAGAYVASKTGNVHVSNSGTMEGGVFGLGVFLIEGSAATIINSGTIKRGALFTEIEGAALVVIDGAATLHNTGTILGDVEFVSEVPGAGGTDFVENRGQIDGLTWLGDGNDVFLGWDGTQGAVFGEGGADFLSGGLESDFLDGGAGDDSLDGSFGNDFLTGGLGADDFFFSTTPNTKTNRDYITDFSQAEGDQIVLDRDVYNNLGPEGILKTKFFAFGNAPETKKDRIVYNENKGVLLYAEKGIKTKKSDWEKFAKIEKGTELDHGDILLA